MKLKHLFIMACLLALSLGANADEGKRLYETYCTACHGLGGGMDMDKRLAPPIAAIRLHYIGTHAEKDAFVAAVTDWVAAPDEDKTLMRGAIKRFKIMPPLPYPKAEVEKIAAYIYAGDIEKPEGFDAHVAERHGKGGMKVERKVN